MSLTSVLDRLERFYGALPPPPRDPFQLFVWEVMSVHSTAPKRDAAMAALRRIPALTPDSMWKAPRAKLEAAVALAGPYREERLRALKTGVDLFRRTPDLEKILHGRLPAARRALKPFPQLGETGAHRILLFAADHLVLPIDARVHRVALRLGYGRRGPEFRRSARSVHTALSAELEKDVATYRRAALYLSHHGLATCTETDPHCPVCPLLDECPEGRKRVGRKGL